MFDEAVINSIVMSSLPEELIPSSKADYNLLLNKISILADGIMTSKGQTAALIAVAESMAGLRVISQWVLTALCLILATIGLYWGWRRVAAEYRARQSVERVRKIFFLVVPV